MNGNDLLGFIGFGGVVTGTVCCVLVLLVCIYSLLQKTTKTKHIVKMLISAKAIFFMMALLSLAVLLQVDAFEYPLVFNAVERSMPALQKLGGLWAGQASSLLFWSCLMSLAEVLAIRLACKLKQGEYAIWVALILNGTLIFFLVPVLFFANPFAKFWVSASGNISEAIFAPSGHILMVPNDGIGLNPSLRHTAMLLHPPTLYLGLIGFFVPYAFALASLIIGDEKSTWIKINFPIMLSAWIFLTCGMFLGSWWAYTILGWGGYWGWDAVEIAGLLPWLLSFGLIHSMVMQIHGRLYKKWVYALSISIALLILFGILITRSGIIESVHAYSTGGLGPMLSVLIAMHLVISAGFFAKRWKSIDPANHKQRMSYADKLVCLFNLCMVLVVAIYLFGQTLPVTSQLIGRAKQSFNASQYELYSAPLLIGLLIITALFPLGVQKEKNPAKFFMVLKSIALGASIFPLVLLFKGKIPLLPALGLWSTFMLLGSWLFFFVQGIMFRVKNKTQGIPSQTRFRSSSFLIHIGFAVLALGILGAENLDYEKDIFIQVGEEEVLENFTVFGQAKHEYLVREGQSVFAYQLMITESHGKSWQLKPMMIYYPKLQIINSIPAIQSNLWRDVQVIMSDWQRSSDGRASIQLHVFPLMSWIWVGGALMIVGGILQLFIKKENSH